LEPARAKRRKTKSNKHKIKENKNTQPKKPFRPQKEKQGKAESFAAKHRKKNITENKISAQNVLH
jgi:hypothetical protein